MIQGRRVFVSEKQNNQNRLRINPNCNIVHDGIDNTYDKIVLWLHTHMNYNVVQHSINNTYNAVVL